MSSKPGKCEKERRSRADRFRGRGASTKTKLRAGRQSESVRFVSECCRRRTFEQDRRDERSPEITLVIRRCGVLTNPHRQGRDGNHLPLKSGYTSVERRQRHIRVGRRTRAEIRGNVRRPGTPAGVGNEDGDSHSAPARDAVARRRTLSHDPADPPDTEIVRDLHHKMLRAQFSRRHSTLCARRRSVPQPTPSRPRRRSNSPRPVAPHPQRTRRTPDSSQASRSVRRCVSLAGSFGNRLFRQWFAGIVDARALLLADRLLGLCLLVADEQVASKRRPGSMLAPRWKILKVDPESGSVSQRPDEDRD